VALAQAVYDIRGLLSFMLDGCIWRDGEKKVYGKCRLLWLSEVSFENDDGSFLEMETCFRILVIQH